MDDGETQCTSSKSSQPHTPTPEDVPSVPLPGTTGVVNDDLDEESQRFSRRMTNFYAARARGPIPGTMCDGETRCAVFCTADIPTETLDLFLECVEEYLSESNTPNYTAHASDRVVIMDTKDIGSITTGSSPPISSCPTAFLGLSLKEVRDWFDANIAQQYPEGFLEHCFLVIDSESTEDYACIFVCTQKSAPGEMHSLRCGFEVALTNVYACHYSEESIEEGVLGSFMRSGVLMTKENLKLVNDGGLYFEGGEVKLDQYWRDFTKMW